MNLLITGGLGHIGTYFLTETHKIKNLTVKDIVKIINKFKKTKIQFVSSKIMNQLSYKVKKNKLKKLGLNLNSNLYREIERTIKILDKKTLL
ncbi:MAG: hypothetical protein H8E55_41790 [Pelagibacterales bacterium]|nr:hypothetical protein [Pelagibacterales bacterium]